MNKYLVELIGTYFLVLTIGLAAGLGHAGALAPLAIGSVLMVMVFAGGHISGAHYNPAVTVAVWMRGKCNASDIPGYFGAQVLGAVLAALTVGFFAGEASLVAAPLSLAPAFVAELLFTFALCWVILNVATTKSSEGNSFYGLAIGFTVAGGAFAVGPISGAAFNPAVTLGLCVMGLTAWSSIGLYLLAQFIAAAVAAVVFKVLVKG